MADQSCFHVATRGIDTRPKSTPRTDIRSSAAFARSAEACRSERAEQHRTIDVASMSEMHAQTCAATHSLMIVNVSL
jgi:hypothetical protein